MNNKHFESPAIEFLPIVIKHSPNLLFLYSFLKWNGHFNVPSMEKSYISVTFD